jgi:proteic killer suppression protein
MNISFNNPELADLYEGEKTFNKEFRSNPSLINQYIKTINKLRSVEKVEQLYQYNSLNYEKLKGDRKGYSSVRINKQYRLIFEEVISKEEPFRVILFAIEEISKHYE